MLSQGLGVIPTEPTALTYSIDRSKTLDPIAHMGPMGHMWPMSPMRPMGPHGAPSGSIECLGLMEPMSPMRLMGPMGPMGPWGPTDRDIELIRYRSDQPNAILFINQIGITDNRHQIHVW